MGDVKTSWDGRALDWRNKPTDRFVLRWIKRYLSAPVALALRRVSFVTPAAITAAAAALGVGAGVFFALDRGWQAGLVAFAAQVLDGVDGQLARLRGCVSREGAFLDSTLDRYADLALTLGMIIYLGRLSWPWPYALPAIAVLGFLAVAGATLVSFTSARAGELGLKLGRPTLASKGTRTVAIVLGAWASAFWPPAPAIVLIYLAIHANAAALARLKYVYRHRIQESAPTSEEKQ
jgi:phosphatidylglycerophosphate synthase